MVRSGWFYLRDIVEEKCRLRPACRKLPGLSREKTWITPRLSQTSGAQQRKNVDYKAFRNVGYNKCRDAHRGRMFRLLWTFVDLKLPSAMNHVIHKIVSIKRCQSYFISRRSPHLGISKDSESCASAHRCLHYAYARLIARVTFHLPIKFHQRIQLCGHIHHHGIQDGDGGHAFHDDYSSGDDDGIVAAADGKLCIFTGAVHSLLGAEDGRSGLHVSSDE